MAHFSGGQSSCGWRFGSCCGSACRFESAAGYRRVIRERPTQRSPKPTVLLEIIKLPAMDRPRTATQLLQSGLLKDPKGEVCRAFVANPVTQRRLRPVSHARRADKVARPLASRRH
jgi:hypothetical protein